MTETEKSCSGTTYLQDGREEKTLTFNSAMHGREGAEIRKSYSGTTDLPDSQMGGKKRGVIQEPLTFKTAIWEGVRGGLFRNH